MHTHTHTHTHTHIQFYASTAQRLTLPGQDCTAALTAVVIGRDGSHASFLACSPAGTLRLWSDISSNAHREASLALPEGLSARKIVIVSPSTAIVAAACGRLWRVRIPSLASAEIAGASGMLAGIGRRFSTILGMPSGGASYGVNSLRGACAGGQDGGVRELFVLTDTLLQRWILDDNLEEKMWETNILEDISTRLGLDPARDSLATVDVEISGDDLVVLAISGNARDGFRFHVLWTAVAVADFSSAATTEFDADPREQLSSTAHGFKLVTASGSGHVYVHSPFSAYAVSVTGDGTAQRLSIGGEGGDVTVGGGVIGGYAGDRRGPRPVFISAAMGLISAVSETSQAPQSISAVTTPRPVSSAMKRPLATPDASQRPARQSYAPPSAARNASTLQPTDDKLVTAFSFFLAGNQAAAKNFAETFLRSASSVDVDSAALSLGADVLDAEPSSDVRWAEGRSDLSSAAPLVIRQQLDEKRTRHTEFVSFLTFVGALDQLSVSARHALCEHGEKLAAAIAVRALHNSADPAVNRVIDSAIRRCVRLRGLPGSPVDLFYRQVTGIEGLLEGITDDEREGTLGGSSDSGAGAITAADGLRAANTVFEMMLLPGLEYRTNNRDAYRLPEKASRTPWTGTAYVRSLLLYQFMETERAAEAQTNQTDHLVSQLVSLGDLILRGFEEELAAAEVAAAEGGESQRFEQLKRSFEERRTSIIAPIARLGRTELALALSERYRDFGLIAELCDALGDKARLEEYMRTFASLNFADFYFQWCITRGKRRRLFEQPAAYDGQLARFLVAHGGLKWVHDIHLNDYNTAAATLQTEADVERMSAKRKKTLVSLAKLSALAANPEDAGSGAAFGLDDTVSWCNMQLAVIAAQERLDASPQQPLNGEDVVRKYLAKADIEWNDLLLCLQIFAMTQDFRSEESNRTLLLSVWARGVKADHFDTMAGDFALRSPDDILLERTLRNSTIYKLASAAASRELAALVLAPDAIVADASLDLVKSNEGALRLLREAYAIVARDFNLS
eukprot:Opistho-2@11929